MRLTAASGVPSSLRPAHGEWTCGRENGREGYRGGAVTVAAVATVG